MAHRNGNSGVPNIPSQTSTFGEEIGVELALKQPSTISATLRAH